MTFALVDDAALRLRMFPELTTIEQPSFTQDSRGTQEATWSTFEADVPSQFASQSSPGGPDTEVRNAAGEFVRSSDQVILYGDHEIAETYRAITRGVTFDIVAVQRDSYALVTVLHLERRENAEDAS